MSATQTLVPDNVQSLNLLLRQRAAVDHGLVRILSTSYLLHAALLVVVTLLAGRVGRSDYGGVTSVGVLPVRPLYGSGEASGPRATRRAVPAPVPRPPQPSAAPVRPAPAPVREAEPRVVETATEGYRERRTTERRRDSRPAPSATGRSSPTAATAAAPAAANLPAASAGPGTPTGSLDGDPEGGLGALLFSNRWYVVRIQDIVYSNWGNPYPGQQSPPGPRLATVRFRIQRDGTVEQISLETPSGDAAWDLAARRAVESSRLPPLPADYPGAGLWVRYRFEADPSQP